MKNTLFPLRTQFCMHCATNCCSWFICTTSTMQWKKAYFFESIVALDQVLTCWSHAPSKNTKCLTFISQCANLIWSFVAKGISFCRHWTNYNWRLFAYHTENQVRSYCKERIDKKENNLSKWKMLANLQFMVRKVSFLHVLPLDQNFLPIIYSSLLFFHPYSTPRWLLIYTVLKYKIYKIAQISWNHYSDLGQLVSCLDPHL